MITKFIQIIKENLKIIIVFMILFIIFTIQLPYYIESPGGIINVDDRVDVETNKNQKGSINMAYVGEFNATIPIIIFSKLNKDWDIIKKDEVIMSNETEEEVLFRDRLMLDYANETAIKVAFNKANKKYKITENKIYVIYLEDNSKTNLKIKDEIISIDNTEVNCKNDIENYLKNKKIGDKVIIKVKRDNKIINKYAYLKKYDNKPAIGMLLIEKQKIETKPKVTINFKNSESGPSGGLMTTLNIYNKLIKEDITNGFKIVGTGTISEDGTVGQIDGVKYKLMGAVKNKADMFIVPKENYKEAMKVKEEKKYKIDIIKVETFDELIEFLNTK